mmetsp:Transcript_63453/g.113237  ORF Transcript_63453/g.113237 Transcript_63453/m.113237 type:complete len:85 (-) Transcript_63453:224-478(-)
MGCCGGTKLGHTYTMKILVHYVPLQHLSEQGPVADLNYWSVTGTLLTLPRPGLCLAVRWHLIANMHASQGLKFTSKTISITRWH